MRVAIEAASLTLSSGGLARYTAELSLALARAFPDDEFFLISDQPFRMPPDAPPNLKRGGGPRNAIDRRWWLWGIAREMDRLGADIIHGPDFAVPYLPSRPSVLTLHDLSPWMDAAWHSPAGRVARRTPVLLESGIATMILTPSARVRAQAIERFRLRPERVAAVPEAAAPWFRPVEMAPGRSLFPVCGNAGAAQEPARAGGGVARNAPPSCRSTCCWPAAAARIGTPSPKSPACATWAKFPTRISRALLRRAGPRLPVLYEGFGLPVLEAMQCGAGVIASRAVAETAGDAAEYADSPSEMARAMLRAIEDPGWKAAHRARSLARAREFSWERTARLTRQVYEEARKRFAD